MAKLSRLKQDKLIDQEFSRIMGILSGASGEMLDLARPIVERVAFMTVTLCELEQTIKAKGSTYLFEQGKQRMLVENPAQKAYSTLINRYTATYKLLIDMLPKEQQKEAGDAFENFVTGRVDE